MVQLEAFHSNVQSASEGQPKKHRRFIVPEQGVRLASTVPFIVMFGFYAFEEFQPSVGADIFTWALWTAMTMVLVSSNEMGGVMTDGIRRFLGALITGILATAVVWLFKNETLWPDDSVINMYSDVLIVGIAVIVMMFFSQVFVQFTGYRRTTVMVCQLFIKCLFVGKSAPYSKIYSIITGVCTGVILTSIVSVVILPRSSSYKAVIQLKLALDKLQSLSEFAMHELIMASINPEETLRDEPPEVNISIDDIGEMTESSRQVEQLTQQIKLEDNKLQQCEDIMYKIYDYLDKMKTHLKMSRNEVFIGTRETKEGPKWLLLPGAKLFRCCCQNPLPYKELEYVQYNIRRVARHMWAVLLSIDHMWDDTVQEVIKQRYPAEILPQIHDLTTAVLADIAQAVPSQYYVSRKNLAQLEMAVEVMLNISNRWRTRAAIKQKVGSSQGSDPLYEQGRQRALKRAFTRQNTIGKRTPVSITEALDSNQALKPVIRTRSIVSASPGSASPYASRGNSFQDLPGVDLLALSSPIIHAHRTPVHNRNLSVVMEKAEDKSASLGELDLNRLTDSRSARQIHKSDDISTFSPNQSKRSITFTIQEDEEEEKHQLKDQPPQQAPSFHFAPIKFVELKEDDQQQQGDQEEEDEKSPFLGRSSLEKPAPVGQRMGSVARQIFSQFSMRDRGSERRQMIDNADTDKDEEEEDDINKQANGKQEQEGEDTDNEGGGVRGFFRSLSRKPSMAGRALQRSLNKSRKNIQVSVKLGTRRQRRESVHLHGVRSTGSALSEVKSSDSILSAGNQGSDQANSGNLAPADSNSVAQQNVQKNPSLVQKLTLSMSSSKSQGKMAELRQVQRKESLDVSSMIVDVPLVDERLALSFPETEAGHTQEARWYSFQFQIDELLDALIELHTAVDNLLDQHLPKLALSQNVIDRYQITQY